MTTNRGIMQAQAQAKEATRQAILWFIGQRPGCKTYDIAQLLGVSSDRARYQLRPLSMSGEIVCRGRSYQAVWMLAAHAPPKPAKKIDKRVGRCRIAPEPPPEFRHVIVPAANTRPPRQVKSAVRSVFELGRAFG